MVTRVNWAALKAGCPENLRCLSVMFACAGMLSDAETAKLIGCSKSTVSHWKHRCQVTPARPYVKVMHNLYYDSVRCDLMVKELFGR